VIVAVPLGIHIRDPTPHTLIVELKAHVANDMEPIGRPKQILVVPELRKTH
jgi:acyl-coenzyme A synthetase/AMP-(fatty) acid ligase